MVEIIKSESNSGLPKIKVIGIGGCGNNAVNRLVHQSDYPIEYIAINTVQMVLDKSNAGKCLAIGKKITNGFGAGGDPSVAKAAAGIQELENEVDTLLVISNDKLLLTNEKNITMSSAFSLADSVLKNTIDTITNIIYNCGIVNLDFNDLKTILGNKGYGHLGIGHAGENKTITDAVKEAISSPLLDTNLCGAKYVMINSSGDVNMTELNTALQYIQEIIGKDATVIWGNVGTAEEAEDTKNSTITIIATGIQPKSAPKIPAKGDAKKAPVKPVRKNIPPLPATKTIPTPKQPEIELPDFLQNWIKKS